MDTATCASSHTAPLFSDASRNCCKKDLNHLQRRSHAYPALFACRAGELSAAELEQLMLIVANPRTFKIPDWFLNRQKDHKDGRNSQLTSSQLDTKLREDLERLKKIRYALLPNASFDVAHTDHNLASAVIHSIPATRLLKTEGVGVLAYCRNTLWIVCITSLLFLGATSLCLRRATHCDKCYLHAAGITAVSGTIGDCV